MVEMPSVLKYFMSYHGAGRYDLIFVVSVNRTRITKSCVAKLFNNEWAVSGGRELPITENVQIGTSLVIQWLGLHFPVQGIQVEERRSHIVHSQKTKTLKKTRSNSVTNLVKTFWKINWDCFLLAATKGIDAPGWGLSILAYPEEYTPKALVLCFHWHVQWVPSVGVIYISHQWLPLEASCIFVMLTQ